MKKVDKLVHFVVKALKEKEKNAKDHRRNNFIDRTEEVNTTCDTKYIQYIRNLIRIEDQKKTFKKDWILYKSTKANE